MEPEPSTRSGTLSPNKGPRRGDAIRTAAHNRRRAFVAQPCALRWRPWWKCSPAFGWQRRDATCTARPQHCPAEFIQEGEFGVERL